MVCRSVVASPSLSGAHRDGIPGPIESMGAPARGVIETLGAASVSCECPSVLVLDPQEKWNNPE